MGNTAPDTERPWSLTQASWRDIPFASLIIFVLSLPASVVLLFQSVTHLQAYTVAVLFTGLILGLRKSRWTTITLAAGTLWPFLGIVLYTIVLAIPPIARTIRL